MFDLRSHIFFDSAEVKKCADRGTIKALSRSGAYLRGIARRLVKHSATVKSKPGEPPRDHVRVYRSSILFGFDSDKKSVVVGPARLFSYRTNRQGMPIPQILEEGGNVAPGRNVHWPYGRKGQPTGNSQDDVTNFIMRQGYGPIRWGYSVAGLIGKAKRTNGRGGYENLRRARGGYKTWSRYAPGKGRKVFMQNAKVYSRAQAERSAKIIRELFGPPWIEKGYVSPRPLMGPAFDMAKPALAEFWRDAAA